AGATARAGRGHVLQVAARRFGARGSTLQSTGRAVQRARGCGPDAAEEHESTDAAADTRSAHTDENAGRTIRHTQPDAQRESADAGDESTAAGRRADAACRNDARHTADTIGSRAESDGLAERCPVCDT